MQQPVGADILGSYPGAVCCMGGEASLAELARAFGRDLASSAGLLHYPVKKNPFPMIAALFKAACRGNAKPGYARVCLKYPVPISSVVQISGFFGMIRAVKSLIYDQ